jgi:hypothetical protein
MVVGDGDLLGWVWLRVGADLTLTRVTGLKVMSVTVKAAGLLMPVVSHTVRTGSGGGVPAGTCWMGNGASS